MLDAIVEACKQDEDCPEKQYCYKLSGHCVNYTICSRYNRVETDKLARNPFQCGPCFEGYTNEVLANGHDGSYCAKKIQTENSLSTIDQTALIWLLVGTLNPFIESKEEKLTIENDNNKVVAIDKLVGATAWRTPNWVSNANYGTNRLGDDDDDDDDFNPPNQGNNVIAQVPPVRNVPNTNVPNNSTAGQLAITMPESTANQDNARNIVLQTYIQLAITMPESTANQDNARNIVLQTYMYNYERNTDGNIDNEDTDNNDTDNNANSNTDPTPEPNENGNKYNGKKSMLINQMLKNITMN
ncbi:hypothetical protein X777_00686, partial [Ooceraea biroi]